jgi:hypothetical protein
MDLYDVIFEGKILPGKNINTVKAEFSKLFKISSPKKLNSYFSGHSCVLKKAISLDQVDKYERALLGIGAYCQHNLIEGECPVESIEFKSTQVEQSQPAGEDDEISSVENDSADGAVDEGVVAIEFEYSTDEELGSVSQDEVAEPEKTSGEANAEPEELGNDQSADEDLVAIEFEYGTVEELVTESKHEVVDIEQSLDEFEEESGDDQSVDENSEEIEFEYTEVGQLDSQSSDVGKTDISDQAELKTETAVSVSLADLSLVPLEENDSEDEDDDDDQV